VVTGEHSLAINRDTCRTKPQTVMSTQPQ
jgi:hypothetical protein